MKSVVSNIHFAKADFEKDTKSIITYTFNFLRCGANKMAFWEFKKKWFDWCIKKSFKMRVG